MICCLCRETVLAVSAPKLPGSRLDAARSSLIEADDNDGAVDTLQGLLIARDGSKSIAGIGPLVTVVGERAPMG